jgi:hypothetical protein
MFFLQEPLVNFKTNMELDINLQVILLKPTAGVDFGLQKGSGNNYATTQKQRAVGENIDFRLAIKVKGDIAKGEPPGFSGDFVQGPPGAKFIYIDIGTCAGQEKSIWSRRLKIPLTGIGWEEIGYLAANKNSWLKTQVPGTGKDGSPNCATVKPFEGWMLIK